MADFMRSVALVLDNPQAETGHSLSLPAFDFYPIARAWQVLVNRRRIMMNMKHYPRLRKFGLFNGARRSLAGALCGAFVFAIAPTDLGWAQDNCDPDLVCPPQEDYATRAKLTVWVK